MCGIGGRTIAEAQTRLSYDEFCRWASYRALRGRLNPGLRIEAGTALLATIYANSHSKRGGYTVFDFMPHMDAPPVSLEQAMKEWK